MALLRDPLLALSRSERVKRLVSTMPVSAGVVRSYVPGETTEDAVGAVAELASEGLLATLDYLGEDTEDEGQAELTVQAYVDLLAALADRNLTDHAEVSVKLSAIGQALPEVGDDVALANARRICQVAHEAGTTVTLDMEDHTTTDRTLRSLYELRQEFPRTGGVLQAYLHRTESDARAHAYEGSRIRICKGAYAEPDEVALQAPLEVSRAYVRVLKTLMASPAYPMMATHDPQIIAIASTLASRYGRAPSSYEFQMLFGVRPDEQRRLAAAGEQVRVYIPYGEQWYGYLMRRMAERPANLALFARSLVSKK